MATIFITGLCIGIFVGITLGYILPGTGKRLWTKISTWPEEWIHRKRTNDFLKYEIDYRTVPNRNDYPPEEHIDPPGKWKN